MAGGANKNPAGTLHLDALFDQNTFVRLGHSMLHHPRCGTAGSRTGCRIFAIIEEHARMQPGGWVNRLAGRAKEELSTRGAKKFRSTLLINLQSADGFQAA